MTLRIWPADRGGGMGVVTLESELCETCDAGPPLLEEVEELVLGPGVVRTPQCSQKLVVDDNGAPQLVQDFLPASAVGDTDLRVPQEVQKACPSLSAVPQASQAVIMSFLKDNLVSSRPISWLQLLRSGWYRFGHR